MISVAYTGLPTSTAVAPGGKGKQHVKREEREEEKQAANLIELHETSTTNEVKRRKNRCAGGGTDGAVDGEGSKPVSRWTRGLLRAHVGEIRQELLGLGLVLHSAVELGLLGRELAWPTRGLHFEVPYKRMKIADR